MSIPSASPSTMAGVDFPFVVARLGGTDVVPFEPFEMPLEALGPAAKEGAEAVVGWAERDLVSILAVEVYAWKAM